MEASPAADPPLNVVNDGAVVTCLFFMAVAIALTLFNAVNYYFHNPPAFVNRTSGMTPLPLAKHLMRLLSGWANVGNSVAHAMLVVYMKSNAINPATYWMKERELGGIEGPVILLLINLLIGLASIQSSKKWPMKVALGWNSFAAVLGIFLPVVWPRFLEEGLTTWPYIVIFIWFMIFTMELTALITSATYYLMEKADLPAGKSE